MTQPGAPVPRTVLDGRYELDEELNDWGLGDAWRARDGNFTQRAVVLKLLGALHRDDGEGAAGFTQQARALRGLRHPNVLPVVNHGLWERRPYVVTDLVGGTSLGRGLEDARSAGRRLEGPLVDRLFALVCTGVSAAHEAPRPLAHGGLNPTSVRVDRVGDGFEVRVMDFGLAALLPGGAAAAPAVRSYAAPEVRAGAEATPMGDVFALGMLLVEMLTAGPHGGRRDPLLDAIARDGTGVPGTVQSLRDDIPSAVWDAISRAVRHDPTERYASAGALRDALRSAWTERPVRARVATIPAPTALAVTPGAIAPAAVPMPLGGVNAPPPLTDLAVPRATPAPVSRPLAEGSPSDGPSLVAAPASSTAPRSLGVLPSVIPDLVGPAPRAAVAMAPPRASSSAWEQNTDVVRRAPDPDPDESTHLVEVPPPSDESTHFLEAPPPSDESTHFLEAPPPSEVTPSIPPPPDERERTTVHDTTDDPNDVRATTPALRAVPYAIPASSLRASPGGSQNGAVSQPPPPASASGVLRSFDNVVGRLSSADDWSTPGTAKSVPSRPSAGSLQGYHPPGAPPGVMVQGASPQGPWVDRRALTAALPAAPRQPRASVVPWVIASVLVLLGLTVAAGLLLFH